MSLAPYWTEADQAELDLLTHELVRTAFVHGERCSTCRARGRSCPAMLDAIEAVLEWREGRVLRSKAAWLRTRQQAREELLAA